jgi:ABC-2 type transport system ATP-binding protein
MPEETFSDRDALEVVDLVKKYGNFKAVDHLSLQVRQGEVFGFLGPNGAGKTTSIQMMCGLLKPTSGRVYIKGQHIQSGRRIEIRSKVGICPQENILWNKLTCYEQLVFSACMYDVPLSQARARAGRLLDKMGLNSKRNKLAGTLSGGLKRRMNVIMAMMHDPEILVFDEAEAGLDPQSRALVRDLIQEIARDKTVIVSTHNMDEAERIASRVAIIDSGSLLQLDTPDNLKKSIGEGDVLEMKLFSKDQAALSRAKKGLKDSGYDVIQDHGRFHIRALDLVPRIHEINMLLKGEGISVNEMKIRENTLEDVFLHLTGKSLRK